MPKRQDYTLTEKELEQIHQGIKHLDARIAKRATVIHGLHLIAQLVSHQRWMQYQQVRADGYSIGSGGVESGIKQFKQRLSGAGMRWS